MTTRRDADGCDIANVKARAFLWTQRDDGGGRAARKQRSGDRQRYAGSPHTTGAAMAATSSLP
jgi:hypothetical protein